VIGDGVPLLRISLRSILRSGLAVKKYKPTIGMEIHVELKTTTKMFCGCLNEQGKVGVMLNNVNNSAPLSGANGTLSVQPNKNVCPICLGHPGTLPVPNKKAIESVIKAGLALNCKIAEKSKFDRKQYFYPDLPKGYQISQFDQPLCEHGELETSQGEVGITRIHLEEDTGKLSHVKDGSLVDYNRAGIPLMELVSEPDIKSGEQAKEFCQELQAIFRELGIADANMEKGQMRCEVNVSVSDTDKFGTKVEIKNLNSFKVVEKAINYEIKRQTKALESGEEIVQETRGWDDNKSLTFSQRIKEGSADYRYFPEPDIPPIKLKIKKSKNQKIKDNNESLPDEFIDIEKLKQELPELPKNKRERFKKEYGFKNQDAKLLASIPELADYSEQVVSELKTWLVDCGEFEGTAEEIWESKKEKIIKLVSGWLINKLGGILTARKLNYIDNKITAENFAEFITMILTGKVSSKNANLLLEKMFETGGDPSNILQDEGLKSEEIDLDKIITEIINKNPDQVAQFKSGKTAILKFLIGQVMKESKGQADPKEAEDLFLQKLS
jgi:aspartyl-tRNA(Asn)/glutamyl-tRNA(Gln) amidotransferase subunit B